ncbi:ATP-grasp domain-containing protein [Sphaerisporangium aureirubrum]|uniref:RimK family alpha-L-glutamate ligase n=1 Tax=Sphaerisporangium aureirubrum TaxID=1544736 RepID=A0ABW1NML9_9ACTN
MLKVAYVTYDGPDPDRELVLADWARAGIDGRAVRWDDPAVRWERHDAAVVRSTWNYVHRRDEFVAWAYKVEGVTRLLNPAAMLDFNSDKSYLRGLGVPTVPTHWIRPGDPLELPDLAEYVVKPSVSAGARDTIRTADRAAAGEHVRRLVAGGRVAMVQPYLGMVEDEGETSLIYFGGALSHARRRNAMLAPDLPAGTHLGTLAREPGDDQLDLAARVLATLPETPLYARVDLVRLADGAPAVIELELVEPHLYLSDTPGAAGRLTAALLGLL